MWARLHRQAWLLLPPWNQEAVVLSAGTARGKHAVCGAEHVFHALCFPVKVTAIPLDNADGVDPEVLESKLVCHHDSVLECRRQLMEVNIVPVCLEVFQGRAEMRSFAPWVRQGHIIQLIHGLSLVEIDADGSVVGLLLGIETDEPRRQGTVTLRLTFWMVIVAIFQPLPEHLVVPLASDWRQLRPSNLDVVELTRLSS